MCPITSGSISVQWLGAAMKPPAGSFSSPSHFLFITRFMTGRTIPATMTKAMWLLAVSFTASLYRAAGFLGARLVTAVDDADAGHAGGAGRRQGGDEVGDAAGQVGHVNDGAPKV